MKKKWGQHFLVRQKYVDRMFHTAQVKAGDQILEIGPGKGILTRKLLEIGAEVTAIEIDPHLYQYLQNEIGYHDSLRLWHRDVLEYSDEELQSCYSKPFKIIANLPYNIATPLFFKLMAIRQNLYSITVIVQLEVAERFCATPADGKTYGVLSVAADLGFKPHMAFTIPPSAFSPPPKVTSAVVYLEPHQSGWSVSQEQAFLQWMRQLFQQRRKTLMNNIKQHYNDWFIRDNDHLRQLLGSRRAETLTSQEWKDLYRRFEGL